MTAERNEVGKRLPSGIPEGGIHVHMLEREFQRTKVDGRHFHMFRLPDGSFLQTAEDGGHAHDLEGWGDHGCQTSGAQHAHNVTLADGTTIVTEADGWHTHDLQTDSTAFDGVHTHLLRLPSGDTIESLTPRDFYILEGQSPQAPVFAPAPPASELAKRSAPVDAQAYQSEGMIGIVFDGYLLRLHTDDPAGIIGVRGELVSAEGWDPTDAADLGKGQIEYGLLETDQQEFFLQLPELPGTLLLVQRDGLWTASLSKDCRPQILRSTDVEVVGRSCLPKSLEQDIPPEVRWWTMEGPQAKLARDWLVETDYFGGSSEIRLVGKAYRKVEVEKRYFAHVLPADDRPHWSRELLAATPIDLAANVFAHEDPATAIAEAKLAGATAIFDPPPEIELVQLAELIDQATSWVAVVDDVAEARVTLASRGTLYKLRDPAASGVLVCTPLKISAKFAVPVVAKVTNFPIAGADQPIALRHSQVPSFDRAFAEELREGYPEIWSLGDAGGAEEFALWKRALRGDTASTVKAWVQAREAWATRDLGDSLDAVVAQIQRGVVGPLGMSEMKALVNAEKAKVRVKRKKATSTWVDGLLTSTRARYLHKADPSQDEERFVYGVVAEPDEVDTQGDTQSAEEIRQAAHRFMAEFGTLGVQHKTFVAGRMRILESFIAPADFEISGETVKRGSWLLGVRAEDDQIWTAVKSGSLTGFSFGGEAVREPLAS